MSDNKPVRLPQLRLHYSDHKREGNDDTESDNQAAPIAAAAAATVATSKTERKRPRYLSDIDRSIIIQRLEKGDKQADLAREFGVTRAAICHINKNKGEMLTRFDEFARTPHGRVLIENYSRPSTEFESVTEVRTASATVLTTRVKDRTTAPRNFRAAADRLIKLLLEEALVSFGSATASAESFTSQGIEFLTMDTTPCAVALDREGTVMLDIFKEMEPEASTGSINVPEPYGDEEAKPNWQVMTVDLPEGIATASVLLLVPVFSSASFACAAIDELRARNVQPASICIVCVSCSFEAARDTASQHPDVSIITASLDKRSLESSEPLDDFLKRYLESTAEANET